MAQKFHLTPKGQARPCSATIQCRYAENGVVPEHYDTKEEAQAAYEKIAEKSHGTTNGLTKNDNKAIEIHVEGYDNFNAATADPTEFDSVLSEVMNRQTEAGVQRDRAYERIQRKYNKLVRNPETKKFEYAENSGKVLAGLRAKENPSDLDKEMISNWEKAEREEWENTKLATFLDRAYRRRGSWNRAFLVSDGHLHKSMNCSTCNKGDTPTKFQFMTEYSAKNEKEIVDAAGYRACTTCYPSAPIGNANTLPSKMLTDDEKAKENERKVAVEKKTQKANDAVSKAPTLSGAPLKVMTGLSKTYPEEFKTERAATTWYVNSAASTIYASNENYETAEKNARYKVLYNLAEKNNVSMRNLQNDLQKKIEAKSKKNYKESLAMYEMNKHIAGWEKPEPQTPDVDNFDIPDELFNKSPQEWETADYIPE